MMSAAWLVLATAMALILPTTARSQVLTTLYNFQGPPADGLTPEGGVTLDPAGNMFGATESGGLADNGTVYKLAPSGVETVLHSFQFFTDGDNPYAHLVRGPGGALYGTTTYGGPNEYGTVFSIRGTILTVLYGFRGSPDGLAPSGIVENIDGNLYGTTAQGGTGNCAGGCGTIYRLDKAGHESVVHSFDGPNGAYPSGTLIHDREGNLYGTTVGGGLDDSNQMCPGGCGTAFMLSRSGKFTVMHKFTYGPSDGWYVVSGLVRDGEGNLYGTTSGGGAWGDGIIYEITNTGEEKVLYSFAGTPDGSNPGPLVIANGRLYGTTVSGGQPTCWGPYGGCGTIFEFDKSGKERVIYAFNGVTDGAVPVGPITFDSEGNMYGTTESGPKDGCPFSHGGCGTVWKFSRDSNH
ncbi:MAG: choice-of-anchor tandem repeat GloVer-containing protein [Candidatus Sulfotelmatobacter sp.]